MNRDGHQDTNFFVGREVERTPAFGKRTLFVIDVQSIESILLAYKHHQCEHIFFGANHSFDPADFNEYESWDKMITYFLDKDLLCTLDIPITQAEQFLEGPLVEYENFIPQLRVPIPYIKQWNYNTMIKLDDKDFKATNPGVWCHNLHDLMDRSKYTDWKDYEGDTTL